MLKGFFDDQKFLQGDVKIQNVKIDNQIGRGNSDVFLAYLKQQKIAIKQTQIKSDYQYQNFLKQISTLKNLSNHTQCLIGYFGYFITVDKTKIYNTKRYGYLLMQRAEMNLYEFVKNKINEKSRASIDQIVSATNTLITGFAYLENVNTAHCDIKPENILVTNLKQFKVKICDVGSCKVINQNNLNQATIKGTLSFLAPELVKIQQTKITSINPFLSDVYSFGLVLLYMITGKKFTSHERKQINEQVYFQIINEWIKHASQILNQQFQIIQVLKKALEFDLYKRPLFKEIKKMYQASVRKKKILKQNRYQLLKRNQTQNQSIQTKRQVNISQKTKLPHIKNSNSSTLVSFHSRQRLTQKISAKNLSNPPNNKSYEKNLTKRSTQKSKKQKDKQKEKSKSKSRISPLQKTTMYSTFSIDKSKVSFQFENKKVINITQQNFNLIPYQGLYQQDKIFVLFYPNIQFQYAASVIIKKQCSMQVFDKISNVKSANNLYLQYSGVQIFGPDENTPTIQNFESVYINLQNSIIEGGYNNLLRSLCPFSLKSLNLQLTGSQITYSQVKSELQRIKNKQISKLDLCWDKAFLTFQNFIQINQKIAKLPLKKLILSLGSAYLKPTQKSRWVLPLKCKILYLNFPNNFLSDIVGNLGSSLIQLTQLKQFYLSIQNNCLNDTDIKVLIKSLRNINTLQKAILNFSWNKVEKGSYCFEQIGNFNKLTSLELRLSKCGISFQQFLQIVRLLVGLFTSNLKILKLTYDRKISKNVLFMALEKVIKQQINQGIKLDIIGYDYSYFMIYIKKKNQSNQSNQKNIRIKIKDQISKNSFNQPYLNKNLDSTENLPSNKTIPYISMPTTSKFKQKQQQDDFSTLPNLKSLNSNKMPGLQKICEVLYSTYPSYQCYICLGCSQNKESCKFEYFCRACIENCEHKGHNIVRTYERKICNCLYNYKCVYNASQCMCGQKMGIQYKKQYKCQKCFPNIILCQGCITQCQQAHPQWIEILSSGNFQCKGIQSQNQKIKKYYSRQQKIN